MDEVGPALVRGETSAHTLGSDAVRAAHVWNHFVVLRFFGDVWELPWNLCLGDWDANQACLATLQGKVWNLAALKIRRRRQAVFNTFIKIKQGLMLMREPPWSTTPVKQARDTAENGLNPRRGRIAESTSDPKTRTADSTELAATVAIQLG